ncbi:MAG: DUF1289 domain-containing protein [Blastomonas fulva]|nr:DUF1289 domain-containing protein [Blastomonas fulva]
MCALEPGSSICTGCGRTLGEIAKWGERDRQPPA